MYNTSEAMYAGGTNANNSSYYLYNNQNYWTMSPYRWNSSSSCAIVFRVDSDGYLNGTNVDWTGAGLRPVINLKADIKITSGNGTLENPYIVS